MNTMKMEKLKLNIQIDKYAHKQRRIYVYMWVRFYIYL